MKTLHEIRVIFHRIQFNDWTFRITVDGERPVMQVQCAEGVCNVTGEPLLWRGRKWFLSYHMTTTELVQTAFKAVLTAMEHEVREQFKYRGATVFCPHMDVDYLVDLITSNPSVCEDERTPHGS